MVGKFTSGHWPWMLIERFVLRCRNSNDTNSFIYFSTLELVKLTVLLLFQLLKTRVPRQVKPQLNLCKVYDDFLSHYYL